MCFHWLEYFSCTRSFVDLCQKLLALWLHENCYVSFTNNFCLVFVDVMHMFVFFIFWIGMSMFLLLNTHEKWLYLWQVAWFFPLCALNLCIIVSYDILNQVLLVPSCYQQLMPKIFIITLHSTQVRALKSQKQNLQPLFFSLSHIIQTKERKTKEDLLENNAMVKCGKTWDCLWRLCEMQYCITDTFSEAFFFSNIFQAAIF